MRSIAQLNGELLNLRIVISLVQAQPLRPHCKQGRPVNFQRFQRRPCQLHVMAVSTVNDNCQWNAVCVRQQAALDAAFAAIRRVGAGFFPHPREPWSWHRQATTKTSRFPVTPPHSVSRASRTPRIRQPRPIPENVDALNCCYKCRCRSRHSTGNPCAAQTKSRPWRPGRSLAGCDSPKDAVCVAAKAVPFGPTACPANASRRLA